MSHDNEGLPVVRLDPRTMQPTDVAQAVGGLPVQVHPPTAADELLDDEVLEPFLPFDEGK